MFKKELAPAPGRTNIKSSAQRGLKASLLETYPLLKPHADAILPPKGKLEATKLPGGNGKSVLYSLESEPLFLAVDPVLAGAEASSSSANVLLPHLKLVHRYPDCFPSVRVDRGAISFVLRGAALMAPGFTSKGGRLPRDDGDSGGGKNKATEKKEPNKEDATEDNKNATSGEALENAENAGDEADVVRDYLDADGRWSRELEQGEPVVVMAEGKKEACAIGVLQVSTREAKKNGRGALIGETHFLGDGVWKWTAG